jgi:hypothetical protein
MKSQERNRSGWPIYAALSALVLALAGQSNADLEFEDWLNIKSMIEVEQQTPYDVRGGIVKSPAEPGWLFVDTPYFGVIFGREYGEPGESLMAMTTIHLVKGRKSDQQFLKYIKKQRRKKDDASRFKILQVSNELVKLKGASCLQYEWLSEDHKDKGIDSSEFQYFKTIGYVCRHPDNPVIAFQMEVSQRGGDQNLPQDVREISEAFFAEIVLNKQGLEDFK